MFQIEHISKSYGKKQVLNDVSFPVPEGCAIGILGVNGSGKSTIAKHMNAILLPSGGKVWVDGMDTAGEERSHLTVPDLLAKFKEVSGKALDNDRMLLI